MTFYNYFIRILFSGYLIRINIKYKKYVIIISNDINALYK